MDIGMFLLTVSTSHSIALALGNSSFDRFRNYDDEFRKSSLNLLLLSLTKLCAAILDYSNCGMFPSHMAHDRYSDQED